MKETVLLLDGQAVQTLAVAEELHRNGYRVVAICNGKTNYGYHSRYLDERYVGPSTHDIDNFYLFLSTFLKTHIINTIIPLNDDSAECVSKYRTEIEDFAHVLIPDYETFLRGYDKCNLMKLCKQNGYPHSMTLDMEEVENACFNIQSDFAFPALLKPNKTTGGRGMVRIDSIFMLRDIYPKIKEKYGRCHLQQYIHEGGRQVKVELFMDRQHEIKYSSVIQKQRYYPVHGGSSCCCTTIDKPKLVSICESVLKDIGWIGFADFDLIENPTTGEFLVMEINPRIPACIKVVNKSGIDYATIIADETLGKAQRYFGYKPGKTLRHLGFEMLWFMKSPDRLSTKPNWFHFFGHDVNYQDVSWDEIPAFLFGTWGNLRKMMDSDFRKAKSGI